MGFRFHRIWNTICLIFCLSFSSFGHSLSEDPHDALDDLLQAYAFESRVRPRTGVLYKVPLPSNLSGMEVSVVRLRSGNFWTRGANFSSFHIPPRIIPTPFVRRLAIVYQNLGTLSSHYFNVPGYTLVTPVVGFMAYDASNSSINSIRKLNINATGDLISIKFPNVSLPGDSNITRSCATFGTDGSVHLSEMTLPDLCFTHHQGRFAVVVPVKRKQRRSLWKCWVIGFGLGFSGLVLVILFGIGVSKFLKMKNIGDMEKKADEGVAFKTVWVGTSKMPSAAAIRTQPVLENSYVP